MPRFKGDLGKKGVVSFERSDLAGEHETTSPLYDLYRGSDYMSQAVSLNRGEQKVHDRRPPRRYPSRDCLGIPSYGTAHYVTHRNSSTSLVASALKFKHVTIEAPLGHDAD